MKSPEFRKAIRHWFSILFSLLGAGGLVYYIGKYSSELVRLREFSAMSLGLLLLLVVLGHVFSAMKFRLSASAFGVDLPFCDAFMMVESGSLVNIVPFSAMGFRALYLKKVHGLKYAHFSLGIFATLLTGFTSAGLLGITGVFNLAFEDNLDTLHLLAGLFIAYIFTPLLLLVAALWSRGRVRGSVEIPQRKNHWWSKVYDSLLESLDILFTQRYVLFNFLLLNLITNFVLATRIWLVSRLLGYPFNFWSGLVLQSVGQLSSIVTVLPAGTIGLREALIGLGARGLGNQTVSGVIVSTVDRLVATFCIVFLGGVSMLILRNKIAQAERTVPNTDK